MEDYSVPRRPSLYTAIRLARIIQHVRERLKARVLTRARKDVLDVVEGYSVEKVWGENMVVGARQVPAAIKKKLKPSRVAIRGHANFAGLLQDLDHEVASRHGPLTVVAARDDLFLKQEAADLTCKHIHDVSHVLDVSTLLIERVQLARIEKIWEAPEFKHLDAHECEKYLANLEHLLLCFQQAALEALINHSLNKLQADYQHWDQYLKQQKKVYNSTFSEWASGRPPLNSTMPWNIKPSLVVLWGVCWMFYAANAHDNSVSPQGARQPRGSEQGWNQEQQRQQQQRQQQQRQQQQWAAQGGMQNYGFQAQSADSRASRIIRRTPPQNTPQVSQAHITDLGTAGLGLHVTNTSHTGYQGALTPMSQSHDNLPMGVFHRGAAEANTSASPFGPEAQATLANQTPSTVPSQQAGLQGGRSSSGQMQNTGKRTSYINTSNITPSSSSDASFATPSPAWQQQDQTAPHHHQQAFSLNNIWQPSPDATNISTPTSFSYPQSATSVTSHAAFDFNTATAPQQNLYNRGFQNATGGNYQTFGGIHLGIMDNSQGYPSPQYSDASGRGGSLVPAPIGGEMSPSVGPHDTSPESGYSPTTRRSSGGTNREPPRNQLGVIYCEHAECSRDPPTFNRKCEWTKHMDKHTRPYVCHQPGCEKIRGFTYSGGLLRHEREVHKKYGGPKAPRFCPHKDCKRSTGAGFSRKENLHEHLRRVHRGVGIEDDDAEKDNKEGDEESKGKGKGKPDEKLGEVERKRKKADDEDDEDDELEELRRENKRLRTELEQQGQRLKIFEDMFMRSMGGQGFGQGSGQGMGRGAMD